MLKPIHIVALAPYQVFPAKMGGQKGIALFYSYLSKLLPVTIVSTKNNQHVTGMNGQFLSILSNNRIRYINPFLFFTFRKVIKNNKATHLIIEHPYFGWLGMLLKKFTGVKLVVHSHNIEALRFKSTGKWWWPILYRYERFTHRHADINFFISNEDREYAIAAFKLNAANCYTITYGSEVLQPASLQDRNNARKQLSAQYQFSAADNILLFNGTLNYGPNLDALKTILDKINPILKLNPQFRYKIFICGKGLPDSLNELKNYTSENIIYAGFVDDISVYFKAADIFINPVSDGGGIKTKLVEALGYGVSAVSYANGAIGVPTSVTGNKLLIVPENDNIQFANAIMNINRDAITPPEFFDYFYWGNIAKKALHILQ